MTTTNLGQTTVESLPRTEPSRRMRATLCALLMGLVALPAAANTYYSEDSLSGNLQNQCTAFTATLVADTSLTVTAECNKDDEDNPGTVDSERVDTSIDLSDNHVVWNASSRTFTWDGTVTDANNLNKQCTVGAFSYSVSDVTLGLNCEVESVPAGCPTGTTTERDAAGKISACRYAASLPLNGEMSVELDGTFGRR